MPKVSFCPSTDTFSDLTMARQGYPRMAFSACFGGIIFSILSMPGPGCWHVGQELPKIPCLQPRRAPCAVGSLERSWDPSQSPSNTGKARGVPTVQGTVRGLGGAGTQPAAPPVGTGPTAVGTGPPCPHSCPSWAGVQDGVWQIWDFTKGRREEGCALLGWVLGEASPRVLRVAFSTETENASAMQEGGGGWGAEGWAQCCVSLLNVLQTSWWAWGWAACCR